MVSGLRQWILGITIRIDYFNGNLQLERRRQHAPSKFKLQVLSRIILSILFLLLTASGYSQQENQQLVIYLVRHAHVDLDKPILCSSYKAGEILDSYDTQPIESFDPTPVLQKFEGGHLNVYTSGLPRAMQTAAILFPENDSIHAFTLFNEYDLSIVSVPVLPLPYKAWTVLSRFFWAIHLNKKAESRMEATRRMKSAADLLVELSENDKATVLVAHGFLISDLRRELKKRGWAMVSNGGNKNLAVSKLVYLP
jgi:broad specificity phosphatase PhoE